MNPANRPLPADAAAKIVTTKQASRKLYKYRPIDRRTRQSIVEASLWFSRPSRLNDPFDCRHFIDYRFTEQELDFLCSQMGLVPTGRRATDAHRETLADGTKADAERRIEGSSVLCLSLTKENFLMFSHYADAHRGCVLEFTNLENEIGAASKVVYSSKPPVGRFFDLFAEGGFSKLTELCFLRKAHWWRYEKEVRVVRYGRAEESVGFPRSCLTAIYFGCRTPVEKMKQVMRWCRVADYPHVRFFRAELKATNFGIRYRSISRRQIATLAE